MDTVTAQALVARNIGDIESAVTLAEQMGDDLWEAVRAALCDRLEAIGWHVSEFDGDRIWFAPREWLVPEDKDPDADPWFSIAEYSGIGDEYDHTYLAEFLQSGPNGAGVALWFKSYAMEKKRYRQRFTGQDHAELAALLSAGFEIDSQHWMRLPIRLEAEAVAQGADDENYADALKPLQDGIDVMLANFGRFDALIQAASAADEA